MRSLIKTLVILLIPLWFISAQANTEQSTEDKANQALSSATAEQLSNKINQLKEPMYNPFIERYLVDEVKALRDDMHALEVSLTKEVVNREVRTIDRVTTYATDTVTYFFYLIAGVSSVLVMLGWTSMRDIKDKIHSLADNKVNEIVSTYEERFDNMEKALNKKTVGIQNAQQQLEQHQDIHTLWLKAAQENLINNKISIYDQILEIDPNNTEALTYKADAALELSEPIWAINLCQNALRLDPENAHAFYQLAGAYSLLNQIPEALSHLEKNIQLSGGGIDEIKNDLVFKNLINLDEFQVLIQKYQTS
ncbi:MAG: hypothetical protein U9R28_06935 [Pseudomonadota bacterium]|nr:hypothetical protein [Pseudomonadota bacterium]